MSNSVDNRVVQMEFDNKQFEKGVKQTLGSLDKLNESLKLENSSRGLKDLQRTADRFNLNGITDAAQMAVVGFKKSTAFMTGLMKNLADDAYRYGKKIATALTVQMPKEGFSKYGEKVAAVQTIMYSTGKSIEYVDDVLDRLMEYTDLTSYSFSNMTSSISKFTSAGIDLDTAERAMEGIANWAASAGVGPEKASSAFYNLTQAMSAGAMKSIDWKSISLLNMNTKQFKETVIATTEEMIKSKELTNQQAQAYKKANVNVQNFDTSLSNGWFSKEIMLKVFEKYADRTGDIGQAAFEAAKEAKTFEDAIGAIKDAIASSWMQTWEHLFGNYEEAKVFWTNMCDAVIDFADRFSSARNSMLEFWHDFGGRDRLIEALTNAWEALLAVMDPIIEAFDAIFSPEHGYLSDKYKPEWLYRFAQGEAEYSKFGDYLIYLSEALRKFTEALKPTEERLKQIKRIFMGLFASVKLVFLVIKSFVKAFKEAFGKSIKDGSENMIETTASLGDFMVKLADAAEKSDIFYKAFKKIFDLVNDFKDKVKEKFDFIISKIEEFTGLDLHTKKLENLGDALWGIIEAAKTLYNKLKTLGDYVKETIIPFLTGVWSKVGPTVTKVFGILLKAIGAIGLGVGKVIAFVKAIATGEITIDSIRAKIEAWKEQLKELAQKYLGRFQNSSFEKFLERIPGLSDSAREGISKFVTSIRDRLKTLNGNTVLKLAGIATLLLIVLLIRKAFKALAGVLSIVSDATGTIKELMTTIAKRSVVSPILQVAIAIGILAVSLSKLAVFDDSKKLWNAVGALAVLGVVAAGLAWALSALTKSLSIKDVGKISLIMLSISGAFLIFASALRIMDGWVTDNIWAKVGVLVGVVAVMGAMAIAISALAPQLSRGALFMIGFALAVRVIMSALLELVQQPLEEVKKRLPILGGIIGLIALIAITAGRIRFGAGMGFLAIIAGLFLLGKLVNKLAENPVFQKVGKIVIGIIEILYNSIIKIIEFFKKVLSMTEEGAKYREDVAKFFEENIAFFTIMALGMMLIAAIVAIAGVNGTKAFVGFMGSVLALVAVVVALEELSSYIKDNKIDINTFKTIAICIGGLVLAFGAAAALSGLGKGGFNMLALAVSLWILFGIIKKIATSGVDTEVLKKVVVILGVFALVFSVAALIGGKAGNAIGAIAALTIAITLLLGVMALLTLLPEDKL